MSHRKLMLARCVVLLAGAAACGSGSPSKGPSAPDSGAGGVAGTGGSGGGDSSVAGGGDAAPEHMGGGGDGASGDVGGGPADGSDAGGGPADGSDVGGGPADGSDAGGGPADGSDAGGGPADGSDAGGGPADGSDAGGVPASDAGVDGVDAGGSGDGGAGLGGDDSPTLIARALGDGEITAEQALIYEVFADFDDPRLPAQYRGDDSHLFESDVLGRALAAFDSLSTDAQDILQPYLLRPSEPGSWTDPSTLHFDSDDSGDPDASGGTLEIIAPIFCSGQSKSTWKSMTTPTAHVQVWYDSTVPADAAVATTLLDEVENRIWPKLMTTLGLRVPLSDADPATGLDCGGNDGRLDIYLADIGKLFGTTYPRSLSDRVACKAVPVVVYINKTKAALGLTATLTHELMHAIQWAYPSAACHDDYGWMNDAMANWAIDYVYHGLPSPIDVQAEQNWSDCFTQSPEKALDDRNKGRCVKMGPGTPRDYGSYLFFQFMSNHGSPALVKSVLDSLTGYTTSLEAVAALSPSPADYLRDNWNDFARALLNKNFPGGVLQPNFDTWDSLPDKPKWLMEASFAGVTDKKFTFVPAIDDLSTHYYHFTFPDQSARTLLFSNGFFNAYKNKKAIRITALWHDAGGTWQAEDWEKYQYVGLCRDSKNQRTDELILIVSNGEWQIGGGGVLSTSDPFLLEASSIGCWKYRGTSTCNQVGAVSGGTSQVTSDLSFILDPRAAAMGIAATHPAIPDSLRTGLHLEMPLESGQPVAEGSYTYQASRTAGMCPFTFGPVQSPISYTENGVLQIDTFPDLQLPASAGDLPQFVANNPQRYYQMSAASTMTYQSSPPAGCTADFLPVAALALTSPNQTQLVDPSGNINLNYTNIGSSCVGTFSPQLEP